MALSAVSVVTWVLVEAKSVHVAVPIPAKDQRVISGGLMRCQHFGEFTIGPVSGSIIVKTSVPLG